MHTHWIDIFNCTNDDAIIRFVANDFHFIFFPPQKALIDENFICRRSRETRANNLFKFLLVIGNSAACAAHSKGRTDNRRQTCFWQFTNGFSNTFRDIGFAVSIDRRSDNGRARIFEANLRHGRRETLPRLGFVNDVGFSANHLNAVFLQCSHLLQS